MEDTPKSETATIEPVKNEAQVDVTTLANELAEAKRKAEQAEMRARQLENAEAARKKLDDEARNKKLEEDNEFRILYEREKEQRESLEHERELAEIKAAIDSAKKSVLSDFSDEVKEVAEAAGMTLSDDSEEAKAEFKAKLEVISSKIGNTEKKVIGNNGPIPKDEPIDKSKLYGQMRVTDPTVAKNARKEAISKLSVIEAMNKFAGITK